MNFLKGRTNRAVYWLSVGLVAALLIGFSLLTHEVQSMSEILLVIMGVPRLHDIGRSGWWMLLPVGLEIIGAVAAFTLFPLDAAQGVMGIVVLLILVGMAVLGMIPGQPFANRFGEPPRPGLASWKGSKSA